MSYLGDICNLGHVVLWSWASLHLSFSPRPVLPTPLSWWLDRKQSGLQAPGLAAAGAAVLVLTNGGDMAEKGNSSSLLGQTGAGGAFRSHFIYGDTEAERGGGLSKSPILDALIKEEE